MRDTTTTIIDFYHGAYGPTIRIDINDFVWLKILINALMQLMANVTSEIDLLSLEHVERREISGLKLVLSSKSSLSSTSSELSNKHPSFIWRVSPEDTYRIIDSVSNFIATDKAGHYYLYEDENMLVELAYKE